MKKILFFVVMGLLLCGVAHAQVLRGNLSPSGEVNVRGGHWDLMYETTLASAVTNLTISGLDGDVDKVYRLDTKIKNGYNGESAYYLRFNNDGGNNYGEQGLSGISTTIAAFRAARSNWNTGSNAALNNISNTNCLIYAKSGKVRTGLYQTTASITGTTVTSVYQYGASWNNTADNITSILLYASQANGIGAGSTIKLWRWKDGT